ncbi:MAG: hypothetical protein KDA91_10500 [Planctomycetaceae bacterium]|nr:hypothetical protein [Planctomycetaceae bacterium]
MSYRLRLCATHLMTAVVAGYCAACGFQVDGVSRIAFMTLLVVAILGPAAAAYWWLLRGLKDAEKSLSDIHSDFLSTGLNEIDATVHRLRTSLRHQRTILQDVDSLLTCLGHSPAAQSPNGMNSPDRHELIEAISKLSRSSARDIGTILALCNEIARNARDTQAGSQEQTRTIDSAIQAVADLSVRIDEIGSNADVATQASRDVGARVQQGLEVIQQLIHGMEEIRTTVAFSEKKVTGLRQQSEQISSIVETMGDLSARTDMVALNASIEAVRAGQEGRGFSIVAEEVRRLAERTATASREIAALVAAIQSETQDTMSAMSEEQQQVQQEIQRVSAAGRMLEEIRKVASSAADRSKHITDATTDQLQRTHELVRAMQQVSSIARRVGERSDSIRNKATDLVESAEGLEEGLSPISQFVEGDAANLRSSSLRRGIRRLRSDDSPGPADLLDAVAAGEFAQ